MKRIKTFLEYLIALAIIVLLLFTIASVVVIKFYGDEVESYAMDFVNNQLETEISIDEIGITIFRKFPNTSIFLKNVHVKSGKQYRKDQFESNFTDTLLSAENIYMKFNLIDIIRNDFQINSLEFSNGLINILIDKEGNGNYIFGKNDAVKNEQAIFVDVKKLKISNTKIRYINLAKETEGKMFFSDIDLNGNFSKERFKLNTSFKGKIESFKNHNVNYFSETDISADIAINVDQKKYDIITGNIKIGDLQTMLQGFISFSDAKYAEMDLNFEGKKVDIAWLEDILSLQDKYKNKIKGEGLLNLKGTIKGIASATKTPGISIAFSTSNSSVKISTPAPYQFQSVSFKGSYTNGSQNNLTSSSLIIDHFESDILNSVISGNLVVTNFIDPQFRLTIAGNLKATDWAGIIKNQNFQIKDGVIQPDIIIKGKISGLQKEDRDVSFIPTGIIDFIGLKLQTDINSKPLNLRSINGNLKMQNNHWKADFKGFLESIQLESTIYFFNPLQQIQRKGIIQLSGDISSNKIDIEKAIQLFSPVEKSSEIRYPEKLILDFGIRIDTLSHKKITANNFQGTFSYRFPQLTITPFEFKTMNGRTEGSIQLTKVNSTSQRLDISADYENLDITNLFISMDEFGQDFLTSKNIGGSLSGKTEFSSILTKGEKLKGSNIIAESNISISNGELVNFMPVMEMYRFLDIPNPEHITFSEISNTLLIQENKLVIPEMLINSSAINLSASGTHHFDGIFDYHLAIRLSDYLYKKSRMSKDSEFEIAMDEEDNRTVFLVLHDEGKGVKIELDEAKAIKKVRHDLREEKEELKEILRNEFRTKKDTSNTSGGIENQDQQELRFEFPDKNEADTLKKDQTPKKKWWKKEDENNKKSEFQFIIEELN